MKKSPKCRFILNSKFFIRNSFCTGFLTARLSTGLVDQFLELFPGLEIRDLLRRHFHFFARLGIAAGARLPTAQAEAAEAAQLDLLSGPQRLDDRIEHDVDDRFGLLLRQLD